MEFSLDALKKKLLSYKRADIIFNEPHFTRQLILREGDRSSVIQNLLNPVRLIGVRVEVGEYGDMKYALFFDVEQSKTMILPVIFDTHRKKSLYVLTYIMRYRRIQ